MRNCGHAVTTVSTYLECEVPSKWLQEKMMTTNALKQLTNFNLLWQKIGMSLGTEQLFVMWEGTEQLFVM